MGAGKGPKGKGKGAVGPRGQTGPVMGAIGGGQSEGSGTGGGPPPQPDVQPVWCIPPGIQQMPAHHTHHHHHHHAHLYNIDPEAGDLIPPRPPDPSTSQPPPRLGRSQCGWPLPRRRGGGTRRRRRRHRGCKGSPREKQGGAGPGTGTETRSRTPWWLRPSLWRWR